MSEIKTKSTNQDPKEFLNIIQPEQKRIDSFNLLELFRRVTKEKPVMWGNSMIGFGMYHYKSERSSQEGDWPLVAFSPRKANLTLYLMNGFKDNGELLKKLGKHKISVGCLYINKLTDIDLDVLSQLVKNSYLNMKKMYSK